MRLASNRKLLSILGFFALSSLLIGCPDKDAPEKTTAEPERVEPDDEGKAAEAKKPAAASAASAKPDDDKDKGGW